MNAIDRMLRKAMGTWPALPSKEESLRYVCASLYDAATALEGEGPIQLLLTGASMEEMEGLRAQFGAWLAARGGGAREIRLYPAGPLDASAQAMEALLDCSGVVLFARRAKTTYGQLEKQITFIKEMKRPICGVVLLDDTVK